MLTVKIKDGHFKVQLVKLASDKSVSRIGFKCINLDNPGVKQSELIHETGVVNAEYDNSEYMKELLDIIQIDPETVELSLPVQEQSILEEKTEEEKSQADTDKKIGMKLFYTSNSRNLTEHKLLFSFKAK